MIVDASFIRSAASAGDLPRDGLPELAFVGRSNVGKSSLINALVRQRLARTSAAPGKTRLANIYRIRRGGGAPFYLVDLPGYGYARGGADTARAFAALTEQYFAQPRRVRREGQERQVGSGRIPPPALPASPAQPAALLLVDARHPGLASDHEAWTWLGTIAADRAIVATKIDKLARGERIRALKTLESVHEHPVLPVSAVTGEGMDDLWKLIDRLLTNSRNSRSTSRPAPAPRSNSSSRPEATEAAATDTPPPRRRKSWTSRP